jgi:hypothetical protein
MDAVFPTSAWRILGPRDLVSKPKALKPTGAHHHARGIVDMDRWDDEGGAISTVKPRSIPAIFRGRRDSIKSRKASALRLLSEWRVSRLSRLVGVGLLALVLLVIFGILAPP